MLTCLIIFGFCKILLPKDFKPSNSTDGYYNKVAIIGGISLVLMVILAIISIWI